MYLCRFNPRSSNYSPIKIVVFFKLIKLISSSEQQERTFVASFQPDVVGPHKATNDVWLEFTNPIPESKEFTVCHWIKVRFYNLKYAGCLWSYCTKEWGKEGEEKKELCLQVCLQGDEKSLDRNLRLKGRLQLSQKVKKESVVLVEDFLHRTWVHICWSFHAVTGESKWYYNGNLVTREQFNLEGLETAVKDTNDTYDSAFIFGQEPDALRGKYDAAEAFIGDAAEINFWGYALPDIDIREMASCQKLIKGNVIAWKKSNLINNNVKLTDLKDATEFCESPSKLVLFPYMVRYAEAKATCEIHGGSLAVPKSDQENQKLIDIVHSRKNTCIKDNSNDGNALWIGARKVNGKWYEIASKDVGRSGVPDGALNYTFNYGSSALDNDCSLLSNDGSWVDGTYSCTVISLCFVCLIPHQPVFTLKGTCSNADIDLLYYMSIDDKKQTIFYEGYQKTNFLFNGKKWKLSTKTGYPPNFEIIEPVDEHEAEHHGGGKEEEEEEEHHGDEDEEEDEEGEEHHGDEEEEDDEEEEHHGDEDEEEDDEEEEHHGDEEKDVDEIEESLHASPNPLGRKDWFINNPPCGVDNQVTQMTLSTCRFPLEFTCDSGHCVDISKRCDEIYDCSDGTDEKSCPLINIPTNYKKANAPSPNRDYDFLDLEIKTTIENIDSIDTIDMIVTITMKMQITWFDRRLNFNNPNKVNLIPAETAKQLWTPLSSLIYENAIIGEVVYINENVIKLYANVPEKMDASKPSENKNFNGSYNSFELSPRMKISYNCIFNVVNFPFDDKNCNFIMKVDKQKQNFLRFDQNSSVSYIGSSDVDQFRIGQALSRVTNTKEFTTYSFVIPMGRVFTSQLLNTFLPTTIIWLFGYATFFIDPDHPSDRFMGSGTALLSMATLLNSIFAGLPPTSYVKFVDIWLIWHFVSVLFMITFNVLVHRIMWLEQAPENYNSKGNTIVGKGNVIKTGIVSEDEKKKKTTRKIAPATTLDPDLLNSISNGTKISPPLTRRMPTVKTVLENSFPSHENESENKILEYLNSIDLKNLATLTSPTVTARKVNKRIIIIFPIVNIIFYAVYFYLTFNYQKD